MLWVLGNELPQGQFRIRERFFAVFRNSRSRSFLLQDNASFQIQLCLKIGCDVASLTGYVNIFDRRIVITAFSQAFDKWNDGFFGNTCPGGESSQKEDCKAVAHDTHI